MPGVDEGREGRPANACEIGEFRTLASRPFTTATSGESLSAPISLQILDELLDNLRCEVVAISSCRQEMHTQHQEILNRQLEVLMRLERLDPTQRTLSCNDAVAMDQRPQTERKKEQTTSFPRDANSAACIPLPELTGADHVDVVADENRDELPCTGSNDMSLTTENDCIHAKDVAREDMEHARQTFSVQSHRLCTIAGFVHSPYFGLFFGFLVVVHVLYIGILASVNLNTAMQGEIQQDEGLRRLISHAFCIAFAIELACRASVDGKHIFSRVNRWWYGLDFFVLTFDVLDVLMFNISFPGAIRSPEVGSLRIIRIIRVFRLVRVMKAFRRARGMRLIVLAIASSTHQLFWSMILVLSVIYIFAVFFATAIFSHLPRTETSDRNSDLIEWWGSLGKIALTLTQSVTGGSDWIEPFRALEGFPGLQAVFVFFLCFSVFGVLNVVSGVFCSNAMEMASRDTDMIVAAHMEWETKYCSDLHKLFYRINGSDLNQLTIDKWELSSRDPWIRAYLSHLQIEVGDGGNFFKMLLGKATDGKIHVTEFVEGCLEFRRGSMAHDMHVMMRQTQDMLRQIATRLPFDAFALSGANHDDDDGEVSAGKLAL
eukprot:TRINITY_DN6022_c0_g2_i2.p1 TRINITY_DN6022_c0_g2~~TRINITY_DN6022_c0_g2_i2.p1  ORF type:complete len:602 (+),score=76.68 TRINITY_DN6022_c0_g2_i2:123-1928(+)